jgi:hypothetical protein
MKLDKIVQRHARDLGKMTMQEGERFVLKLCFIFKICNHNSGIVVLMFFGNLLQNEIHDMRLQR